jgi:hypothetical protein
MIDILMGYDDDGYYQIPLPFEFRINGSSYNSVFVSSNAYLTFGDGSTAFSMSSSNPPLNKIFFGAGNNILSKLSFQSTTDYVHIRYEGWKIGYCCEATIFVELTLFHPSSVNGNNVVEVRVGRHARPDGLFGVASETSFLAQTSLKQFSSYVLIGDSAAFCWDIHSHTSVGLYIGSSTPTTAPTVRPSHAPTISLRPTFHPTASPTCFAASIPLVSGNKPPLLGISDGSFPPTGWTAVAAGLLDDGYYKISLPFDFHMTGSSYSSVFVSTNGYITFGRGSSTFAVSPSKPPDNKIFFGAGDNILSKLSFQSTTNYVHIRYEGGKIDDICNNSSCVATIFVELTLFNPSFVHGNNVLEVRVGYHARPDGLFGIASPTSFLAETSLEPLSSYVLIGDSAAYCWDIHSYTSVDY